MRKVTREIVSAFMNDYNKRISNSEVVVRYGVTQLFLHGNQIARKNQLTKKIKITLAGWNTVTTRERLNGLPGVSITQKNFVPYLNGREINEYDMYEI